MTKQNFLNSLRTALSNRMGASLVDSHVRYYEDYINTQVRMGKSEAEVIDELGDPRLLARSIADANKRAGLHEETEYTEDDANRQYETNRGRGYGEGEKNRLHHMPGWLIVFIVVFVLLLILGLTFSVLSFLAPVLLPVLLIVMVVKLCRRT